jgi:glycosyltransferase involved in cell wall biosynthesis
MSSRILCWGTYDTGKPRTRILRDGLRRAGIILEECRASVWDGIEDKSQVRGAARRLRLLVRWLASYPALLWRFMRASRPDLVLIGFPGVLDAILLAPFARLRGVPIVWDMFMSLYDTVVLDRRMLRPGNPIARLLLAVERFAIRRCEVVFLDTQAHARYIEKLFGLTQGRCGAVWVGVETEHFTAADTTEGARARPADAPVQVLFYGQFIPVHGIETIIAAAHVLANEPIEWMLIGRGQESERIAALLAAAPLPKLRQIDWVEYTDLKRWIARADVCLGIFSASEKAASAIPNKVFQIVAAGRPVVTRDSLAIRELLVHAPPCSYLVPPADADALAEAIRAHAQYVREHRSLPTCHAGLAGRIGPEAVGRQFIELMQDRLGATDAFGAPHEAATIRNPTAPHS